MGCAGSHTTAVRPLLRDEDETGSKHGDRGDSAVSKVTTDSGVVMEHPPLPGAVPRKLPTLTYVRENEADAGPGLLQQNQTNQDRKKSCEILEELLNQGIIPVDQSREGGSRGGEAYSIMLDDRQGVGLRRPARLESLKAQKESRLPSREQIEEKIRLAEERRKSREEEFKTRLRAKSARRVRGPAPSSDPEEDQEASVAPGSPTLYSQIPREEAEGGEGVREAGGDGREGDEKEDGMESRDNSGERKGGAEKIGEGGDGEQQEEQEQEVTQVEELRVGQLLSAAVELESDCSFQHEDKEEVF